MEETITLNPVPGWEFPAYLLKLLLTPVLRASECSQPCKNENKTSDSVLFPSGQNSNSNSISGLFQYSILTGLWAREVQISLFPKQVLEPITQSEQLPCARVTPFSRTSLFLERFSREF